MRLCSLSRRREGKGEKVMGWEEALERRRRKEGLVCVLNTSNHVCPYSSLSLFSLVIQPRLFFTSGVDGSSLSFLCGS